MAHKYRRGFRGKSNATQVTKELESLRKQSGGVLTPEAVVEKASNPRTALHKEFEWNDTVAAHLYRLKQARTLIRAIVEEHTQQRKYVRVRLKRSQYVPMDPEVIEVDQFHSALELLEAKLSGAAQSVLELKEAMGTSKQRGTMAIIGIVVKALETAKEAVKKLRAAA